MTLDRDWRGALRRIAKAADSRRHIGETLNFETAGSFFGSLTERRWELVTALQGQGEVGVRELARRVGRDVRRVHDDIAALTDLGLIERTEDGGVLCPFAEIRIDMKLAGAERIAA